MGNFRQKIYKLIEPSDFTSATWLYDAVIIACIIASIIPIAFKKDTPAMITIEKITIVIFILDYLLRWSVADLKLKKGKKSFLIYPITPMAIVDLIAILPGLALFGKGFKLLRLLRFLSFLRILGTLKVLRYSRTIKTVEKVFKKEKAILIAVLLIALGYIFIVSLIMYNAEGDTFKSYFEAIYWTMTSLTTIGYGDICPVTPVGRTITMISSFFGMAIIALPSGVIAAGFMDASKEIKLNKKTGTFYEDTEASESEDSKNAVPDYINELRALKELLDEGILTQEEFDQKKKSILSKSN